MSKVFLIFVSFVLTGCCQTSGSTTIPVKYKDGTRDGNHSIMGVYTYDTSSPNSPSCDSEQCGGSKCCYLRPANLIHNVPFFLWTPKGSPAVAIWQTAWDQSALYFHRATHTLIYKNVMYKPSKYRARIDNRLLHVWVRK